MVLDNLNTHTPASFYKAFEPNEARRLLRRLEFHHTLTHASWLNMVEIELSQRIAVILASCLALLTYHLIVGTFSLLFGTRVHLLMHSWPNPVQYQRNTL